MPAQLSAYDGGGRPMSPLAAYAAFPPQVRLVCAIVDSVIWDDESWAWSVLAALTDEKPPSDEAQRWFAERNLNTAEDLYEVAGLTRQQQEVFEFHLHGCDHRTIADYVGITALAARQQLFRATDKLRRVCVPAMEAA
jgi:DNA-directed RNA polymerase specialized sigma24 family protein